MEWIYPLIAWWCSIVFCKCLPEGKSFCLVTKPDINGLWMFMIWYYHWWYYNCLVLTGTMEFGLTFQKQLGMSSSQLTFTPSFFRGVETINQPTVCYWKWPIYSWFMWIHLLIDGDCSLSWVICFSQRMTTSLLLKMAIELISLI